ncbi:hypothetical protein SLE2022_096560 [Rubroshorea leprosula]
MKGLVVWRMRSEVTTLSVRAEEELPGIEIGNSDNIILSGASLASVESLSMPLVQEIVLSADIRCAECQKRVADIMSRMKETESVLVNVLEKEVTITCKYPGVVKVPSKQAAALYRKPFNKIAMIKNIFCSLGS